MRSLLSLVLCLALSVTAVASSSLKSARRAQAMLGGETWSHVLRIENAGVTTRYPHDVYALVFEEGGLLWFYTDRDGTQSLSLHLGRLAKEKEELGALLKEIDPGFTRFVVLEPENNDAALRDTRPLRNGCFIESLAALRQRIMFGDRIDHPRLLSMYVETRDGIQGHTVLTYRTPSGFFVLDPTQSQQPRELPEALMEDPAELARLALNGAPVAQARWVPTDNPSSVLVAQAHEGDSRIFPERTMTQATQ